MILVATKKRNEKLTPKFMNDFFNNDRFLLDFNNSFLDANFQNILPEANIVENKKEYQIELAVLFLIIGRNKYKVAKKFLILATLLSLMI